MRYLLIGGLGLGGFAFLMLFVSPELLIKMLVTLVVLNLAASFGKKWADHMGTERTTTENNGDLHQVTNIGNDLTNIAAAGSSELKKIRSEPILMEFKGQLTKRQNSSLLVKNLGIETEKPPETLPTKENDSIQFSAVPTLPLEKTESLSFAIPSSASAPTSEIPNPPSPTLKSLTISNDIANLTANPSATPVPSSTDLITAKQGIQTHGDIMIHTDDISNRGPEGSKDKMELEITPSLELSLESIRPTFTADQVDDEDQDATLFQAKIHTLKAQVLDEQNRKKAATFCLPYAKPILYVCTKCRLSKNRDIEDLFPFEPTESSIKPKKKDKEKSKEKEEGTKDEKLQQEEQPKDEDQAEKKDKSKKKDKRKDRSDDDSPTTGQQLYEIIQEEMAGTPIEQTLNLQPMRCLGACSRSNSIAFSGIGKFTYQFGDLDQRDPATLDAIMEFAKIYLKTGDGYTKSRQRPEGMKDNILSRVPPLPLSGPMIYVPEE